jgi:D-xylose transport system substrate-binding protein
MGANDRPKAQDDAGELDGLSRRRFMTRVGSTAFLLSSGGLLAACGVNDKAASTTTAAGGGAEAASAKGKKVAFLLPSASQKRWQGADGPSFEAEAKKLGMTVIVQNANDDPQQQASQLDNVLTQGIDLLVLASVNIDTAESMVQKAEAANVPVIAYNYAVDNVPLKAIVARDGVQVGRDLATAALAKAPKGNYVLTFGDQGTSIAREKARGMMEVLKPKIDSGDIKIVAERYNKDWSPELAKQQVENALTANNNKVVAVIASNDGMAYGVIESLRAQGLNGKVFVSGEDAEVDALKAIKKGDLTASSWTPFDVLGRTAAQMAATVLSGKQIETKTTLNNKKADIPWVQVKAFNVTRDNLDKFVGDNPWWVKPGDLA